MPAKIKTEDCNIKFIIYIMQGQKSLSDLRVEETPLTVRVL